MSNDSGKQGDGRPTITRPERPQYFMGIALAVRARANCLGSRVGAVLALDHRIVATGYNGTPVNMDNCDQGGCHRCANRDRFAKGTGYDVCICVHAEQNALLSAAKFGIAVEAAVLYTTTQPCFGCSKELLQAGVHTVYYLHEWAPSNAELLAEYQKLQSRFPGGVKKVEVVDPDKDWAVSPRRDLPPDTGHSMPE